MFKKGRQIIYKEKSRVKCECKVRDEVMQGVSKLAFDQMPEVQ